MTYHFAPIEARVVDAETGAPIEGAVVMANWELVKGSLDGPRYYGQLEVKETVTDKDGRFQFAGFSKSDSSGAELRDRDPQVVIFKPGYEYQRFTNDYIDGGAGLKLLTRVAAVNGKTVKLKTLRIDPGSRSSAYSGLASKIHHVVYDCHWTKIPIAMREMDKEDGAMRAKGIGNDLVGRHDVEGLAGKCGAADKIYGIDENRAKQ